MAASKYPIRDWEQDWEHNPTDNKKQTFLQVKQFLQEQLDTKAGYFISDENDENILVFANRHNYELWLEDPETYADLLIISLPLSPNYYTIIELVDTQVSNYVLKGSKGNYVKANFKVVNRFGDDIPDSFDVTITVQQGTVKQKFSRVASFGTTLAFNIDDYLREGLNTVTIEAMSRTHKVSSSTGITYNVLDISVSDTFDISHVYGPSDETLPISVNIKGQGLKTIEWFVDGVQLEKNPESDETTLSETTKTRYIDLSNVGEGRHNLQYRAYVESNGVRAYSETMYRDFIVYRNQSNNTIIANAFSYVNQDIIDPTESPIAIPGAMQYVTKVIQYAIYNPSVGVANNLEVTFDGIASSFSVSNRTVYEYLLKSYSIGTIGLTFELNNTTLSYNVSVERSEVNVQPITDTEFEFSGTERSNSSEDKDLTNWTFTGSSGNTYHASMSGFDYTARNGWTENGLMIAQGAQLTFDISPLNYDVVANGGTFEFEFETQRVVNDDEVICSVIPDGGTAGIVITASEAKITSRGGVTASRKFKSGENVRVSFVVNKFANVERNHGLLFMFINGILSGAINYLGSDSFTNAATLSFTGTANAQILLKQVRMYRRSLSLDEILNNYILYRPTIEEMLSIYDKNDVYETGSTSLSIDKLQSATPIIIITGNVQELQDFQKTDKGTYRKMDKIEVINLSDPTKNMTLEDVSMRCQGTSSMNYPKKNFRFYTQADGKDTTKDPYVTKMFDYEGNELLGNDRLYSFKEGAQPVKCWCLKADYAESSSTHNTGTARLWNNVLKNIVVNNVDSRYYHYGSSSAEIAKQQEVKTLLGSNVGMTQAQKRALAASYEYDVRTCVDGFPIVLFYHLNEDDPLIFLGKYNWNNDKSTESVFGFKDIPGFDNSNMECWEIVNGDYPENLFTDVSHWEDDIQYESETMKSWRRAFESRYPDDAGTSSEQARQQLHLKPFAQWINSLKTASKIQGGKAVVDDSTVMAQFSEEKWTHLDVYKIAAYYVYLMRFGAVDQTVKNAMFTTEDGQHWYYINYDNDTILGLDNNGALAFGYDIDRFSLDPRSSSDTYCYAGTNSVLWNNLEADEDFMSIVKVIDSALYTAGLNYENVINMFNEQQSEKWSERIHNLDSQYKYLDVWLENNNNVGLSKLHGSRDTHRAWWLSNRFARYDAINVTGAYKANVFLFRAQTVSLQTTKHAYITPYITNQIYGYGKGGTPIVSGVVGTKDVPISMDISGDLYVGASIDFYNSVFIKKIDISEIAEYLSEVHFESINSEAFDSYVEEIVLGTINSNANTSLASIAGFNNAKYLKKLAVCNFNALTSLDLSSNSYLEEVDARGCASLTGISFPEAAPITTLKMPGALQTLILKDANLLATLTFDDVSGYGVNLIDIDIKNSPLIAFSFFENWMNNKTTSDDYCSLNLEGINWENLDEDDFLAFAEHKETFGIDSFNLKGVISLETCSEESVNRLIELFGSSVFTPGSDLFISIPDIMYMTGPDSINEGDMSGDAKVTAIKFPHTVDPVYSITGGVDMYLEFYGREFSVYQEKVLLDKGNGMLAVLDGISGDITITVNAYFGLEVVSKQINVIAKTYPTSFTIEGITILGEPGEYRYSLAFTPSDYTGTIDSAEWSLVNTSDKTSLRDKSTQGCTLVASDSFPMIRLKCTITLANGSTLEGEKLISYQRSRLTVNASSNQSIDPTDVPIHIFWDGQMQINTFPLISHDIPFNKEITIKFGQAAGYSTPADITFTSTHGSQTKTGDYYAEKVEITFTTDISGATPIIGLAGATVNGEHKTFNGSNLSWLVPFGTNYTITYDDASGFDTPISVSYQAGQDSRSVNAIYGAKREPLVFHNVGTGEADVTIYHPSAYTIALDVDYAVLDSWQSGDDVTYTNATRTTYIRVPAGKYLALYAPRMGNWNNGPYSYDNLNYIKMEGGTSGAKMEALTSMQGIFNPNRNLYDYAFYALFRNSDALTVAPDLPYLDSLPRECYAKLFYGCSNLTSTPIIRHVPNRNSSVFESMFEKCRNLSTVICLIKNPNLGEFTYFMSDTSATGTFYKDSEADWTSVPIIPNDWTVRDYFE